MSTLSQGGSTVQEGQDIVLGDDCCPALFEEESLWVPDERPYRVERQTHIYY